MKNIINIIQRPLVLTMCWVFYLVSFGSGTVRYLFIINPDLSPSLLGKLANIFWYTSPGFAVAAVVLLIVNVWNYVRGLYDSKGKITFYFLGILSLITFVLANYLSFLELSNYSNYLYSTYGITKNSVNWLSSVSLMTIISFGSIKYFERKKKSQKHKISIKKLFAYLAIGISVWYSLVTFARISDYVWYAKFDYNTVFENYLQIMELKRIVPEDGAVVLPSQGLIWPDISNVPIVRYFLFPRLLVSSSSILNQDDISNFKELFFVRLSKNDLVWPQVDRDKKIINFGTIDLKYTELIKVNEKDSVEVYRTVFK